MPSKITFINEDFFIKQSESENFESYFLTHESTKDKDDTDDDESLNSSESICLGNLVGDAVEDVDKTEEHSDEDGHPAWHTLWGHEEADPGDDDEHAGGEVVGDDVECHLTTQS